MEHIEFSDLMELADVIAERLGNPITIEDQHHHVVAYSVHGDTPDPVRVETIMKRKVPESVLAFFWKEGVIQSLMHSDHPVRIPAIAELGLGNRVAISIRKGNEVLGYIWVQETGGQMGEEDNQVLRWAARLAMPRLIQRRDRYVKKEENRREFFWQILSDHQGTQEEIHTQAKRLAISFPPHMIVLVAEIMYEEIGWLSVQKEIDYLLENFKDTTPLSYLPLWTYDKNQAILLGGSGDPQKLEEEGRRFLVWLKSRLSFRKEIKNIIGGFGFTISEIPLIPRSYQQALETLKIKKSLPKHLDHLIGYREFGFLRFLPYINERNIQEGYRNEKLERLAKYDKENHTSLLASLQAFLQHVGKINVTAEILHIHPNTLHYRMKKIQEIGNIYLDDPLERMALYMDLLLITYQDK